MKLLSLNKPCLGRLAIELLTTDEKTAGGIWLPTGRETLANVGRVIGVCDPYEAADDDQDSSPAGPMFSIGQVIVIGKYNGVEIELEGSRSKFIIINESDVLCTLNEDDS